MKEQLIPIVRARMRVKVDFKKPGHEELIEKLLPLIKGPETIENDSNWSCTGLIDPVAYRTIVELCSNKGILQVLDMAVVDSK